MNSSIRNSTQEIGKLITDLLHDRIGPTKYLAKAVYVISKFWVNAWYEILYNRDTKNLVAHILFTPVVVVTLSVFELVMVLTAVATIVANTFKIIEKR